MSRPTKVNGLGSGTPLMQHGLHGQDDGPGAALVVKCGQHFRQVSGDLAVGVAMDFLAHFGLVDRPAVGAPAQPEARQRFPLLRTHVIASTDFAFTRPVIGFETSARDELIATDGELELRTPCDDCTIFMPARTAIFGREGVYLTRPLA